MKKKLLLAGILSCIMLLSSCNDKSDVNNEKPVIDTKITVMSFNIRTIGDTAVYSWDNRRNGCLAMVSSVKPDLIGTQEVTPVQKNWLDKNLKDYQSIGKARDGKGDDTEYSSIYYRIDRFELLENNTFWLSATPDFMSKGWDGTCYRVCTYAKLKFKGSDKVFYLFNTHVDHKGSIAQKQGTLLIREKINKIAGDQAIVFLTGDFNMQPDNANIIDLSGYMNNLRDQFPLGEDYPTGTFNSWGKASTIIDYIWFRNAVPLSYQVMDTPFANITYLSDHFPVLGVFETGSENK